MRILGYHTEAVEALITINVIMFFICLILQSSLEWIYLNFSLIPALVIEKPWTLVTSMFLHADLSHLLFNMIALFFFGLYLERLVGEREFMKIYILGGVTASMAYVLTSYLLNMPHPTIPAVGASGAVFAITGALLVLRPKLMVFIYFLFPMPLYVYVFLYTLWALMEMVSTAGMPSGIAHNAHLGGLIAGIYLGTRIKKLRGIREYSYYY